MIQIYIIHYKKLKDRKNFIVDQLAKFQLNNYEFIEIDRDELENYDISIFKDKNPSHQFAISLSHMYAYEEIKNKHDFALILEDDVILSPRFDHILQEYLTQLPRDFDMCFIGNGCNLHIQAHNLVPGRNIYKKENTPTAWGGNGATRCTDSYIVSKKCAIQICNYIKGLNYKIDQAIDWWLNTACRENNFNIYWAEPTIVTQGSQSGKFKSSY
jgi:glycosyl transferase family 25